MGISRIRTLFNSKDNKGKMTTNPLQNNDLLSFVDRRQILTGLIGLSIASSGVEHAWAQAGSAPSSTGTPSILTAGDSVHAQDSALPSVRLWTYNQTFPGPLLRIRQGDTLNLRLKNELSQPTSLHWHGVRIANVMDGVAGLTQQELAPGETSEIAFIARNAGTYLYRPLVPEYAAEQTERGLAGVFIVDEAEPIYPDDVVLLLDDVALNDEGQVRTDFGAPADIGLGGRLGNRLLINGRTTPETLTRPPGQRVRIRIANIANARVLTLRFDDLTTHVIAADGLPVDAPFPPARNSLTIAPGGRVDVVIDTPAKGSSGKILAQIGDGLPLLTLTGEGTPAKEQPGPITALPTTDLPNAINLAGARRIEIAISGGLDPSALPERAKDPARVWHLGGLAWIDAAEHPLFKVASGTPVVLTLENQTPFLQVLHLHGHHARQLHKLDDGWEPYWLDTIAIPAAQTVRIAFLADNPGRWMIGSTILERLGTGLAGWFEVT